MPLFYYIPLFADYKFWNRLDLESDIGVPNESAWSCKSSHNAAPRSGAAASWHTLWFWYPHISTPTRNAPSLHYPNVVPVRPCWSECHGSEVPLQTPNWWTGSLDPNWKSPVSRRNPLPFLTFRHNERRPLYSLRCKQELCGWTNRRFLSQMPGRLPPCK